MILAVRAKMFFARYRPTKHPKLTSFIFLAAGVEAESGGVGGAAIVEARLGPQSDGEQEIHVENKTERAMRY